MIKRTIVPLGWPCTLLEAPPGPFVTIIHPDLLCFKSDYYTDDGRAQAYNSAGEYFCTGDECKVQPVEMINEDEDI
jgi:hypothetical protein